MADTYVLTNLSKLNLTKNSKPLYLIDRSDGKGYREYVVEMSDGRTETRRGGADDGSPDVFVIGGSEVSLDELHYIAGAQHEKNAERERKGIVPGEHRFKDQKFWQEGLVETRDQFSRMAKGQVTFGYGGTAPSVQRSLVR